MELRILTFIEQCSGLQREAALPRRMASWIFGTARIIRAQPEIFGTARIHQILARHGTGRP